MLVLGLALTGCFEPVEGGSCRDDRDCPDAVCSNVGECASATYRLRVAWTLRGAEANLPGACDGVGELEIVVSDPSTASDHSVRPVPCGIGSVLFDKMPPGYDVVALTAYGADGRYLTSGGGTADDATGQVRIDLRP